MQNSKNLLKRVHGNGAHYVCITSITGFSFSIQIGERSPFHKDGNREAGYKKCCDQQKLSGCDFQVEHQNREEDLTYESKCTK